MSGISLSDLAAAPQWVAWRNDLRDDKPTKVPYCAPNRQAKADDPSTWLTHDRAVAMADVIDNGAGGGVGIELAAVEGCGLPVSTSIVAVIRTLAGSSIGRRKSLIGWTPMPKSPHLAPA